jgi:hypothetical protein
MVGGVRRLAELAVLAAAVAASAASDPTEDKLYSRALPVNVGPHKSAVLRATLRWKDDLGYEIEGNGQLTLFDGATPPTAEGLARLETSAGDAQVPGVGQRLDVGWNQHLPDSGSLSEAEYDARIDVEVTDRSERLVNDDPLRPAHWASYLTLFNPTDETVSASILAVEYGEYGDDAPVLERSSAGE